MSIVHITFCTYIKKKYDYFIHVQDMLEHVNGCNDIELLKKFNVISKDVESHLYIQEDPAFTWVGVMNTI